MTAVTLMAQITDELEKKSNQLLIDFQSNVYALYDEFNFTPVYVEPLQSYSKYHRELQQQGKENDPPKVMESLFVNNNDHPDSNSITNSISTNNDDSLSSFNSSLISNTENIENIENEIIDTSLLQIAMPTIMDINHNKNICNLNFGAYNGRHSQSFTVSGIIDMFNT